MMSNKDIITGLDIGTSAVRIVMAKRLPDGDLQVIGAADTPSQGVTRGSISSVEDIISSISETIEKCERMSGVNINQIVVGISGTHLKTINSQGVVAVSKADGQVEYSDIERALETAENSVNIPNYEVLDTLPIAYNLDDQKNITDPIGMSGVRLEVETQVILALSSQIKTLGRCVYRAGLDIERIVLSILANAEAVLTNKQKEIGSAVVNIGASTTSLVVFEDGSVLHTAVLPIGASHITNDLAICLKTDVDTAEAVKKDFAKAISEGISKRDEVDLNKYSEDEPKGSYVHKKDIAEITEARLEEIFKMVNEELKKIDKNGKLPAGVVLTGGGAKVASIVDLGKKVLKLPVFLGYPVKKDFPIDKLNDLEYTTVLGLVLWADKNLEDNSGFLSNFSFLNNIFNKVKNKIKSILPGS